MIDHNNAVRAKTQARLEKEIELFHLRNPLQRAVIFKDEAIYLVKRQNEQIPYAVPQWAADPRQNQALIIDYGISTHIDIHKQMLSISCLACDGAPISLALEYPSKTSSCSELQSILMLGILQVAIEAAKRDSTTNSQRFCDISHH